MTTDRDVLTTGEVAKICNVAPRTVSKWFDSGTLKGYRIPGSKDRRIPLTELLKFMKAHGIPTDGIDSGRTRVLIADADESVVRTLEQVLSEQTSYEVRAVTSGFRAGLECHRFRPHVLIADLHLGDTSGSEIARDVRTMDALQMTRVIGMSSKLTEAQAQSLRAESFDGFLRKPLTDSARSPSTTARPAAAEAGRRSLRPGVP